MDNVAAGAWGAFFCTATLMLLISLAAFRRSRRRVALMAGLTALFSAVFVAGYLGWLPVEGAAEARLLAHLAVIVAVTMALMLLSTLGVLRHGGGRRPMALLVGLGAAALAASWLLEPHQALALGSLCAFGVGAAMLVIAARGALRGDSQGWTAVAGIACMLVAVAGLGWIALTRTTARPVHVLSALAGVAFLCVIGAVLWARYSYLLELSLVLAHGPSYDPVTRMRSNVETGQMVGDVFFRRDAEARPIGVLAICLANLYALENLHGRAASNHALFVCAARLRRCVPQNVEMGRLGEDGFLLLLPSMGDPEQLAQLARQIRDRLVRPVSLSTTRNPDALVHAETAWLAEVGIGVLATSTDLRPSHAVSTARAMARTAWTYRTRMAFFDQQLGQIAELGRATADGGVPAAA